MSSPSRNSTNGPPDKPDPAQDRWRFGLLIALAVFTGETIDADPEPDAGDPKVHSFAYLAYWLRHQVERVKASFGFSRPPSA